ncbi:MAG: helix-turn-helix domain-containing protein [Candidatus Methylomirabilis oxyfera]|nr:helix-turn-helix domain-containing protein [Candidatus Methylomirabilis oxyfera]
MMDVASIIDRLKTAIGATSDSDLARRLSIPQATLAKWKTRGVIPQKRIELLAAKIGCSPDWLLTGQESEDTALWELRQTLDALSEIITKHPELKTRASRIYSGMVDAIHDAQMESYCLLDRDISGPARPGDEEIPAVLQWVQWNRRVAQFLNSASPEERNTVQRLIAGLRASSDVRNHLIGQLRLIEELVQAKKGAAPGEAKDPTPHAKAG